MNCKDFHRTCIFCLKQKTKEILIENEFAFAILDNYPASIGHTLVIPRRHVTDYCDLLQNEMIAINNLLRIRRKQLLDLDQSIKGFNIGMNCGIIAGQTIPHTHIHLIPRRSGDTPNPQGGVRGAIPDKMHY